MSSRAFSSILSLLLLSLVTVRGEPGEVPSGFRLDVRPDCGSDGIEDAIITVVTDMTLIYASVQCLNGTSNMTTTDNVHFNLPVAYMYTQNGSQCAFLQRNGGLNYVVLSVTYGEPKMEKKFGSLTYTISCSFESNGDNLTVGHEVINGLIAPQQLVNVVGQDSNASLSLTILDVLGNDITGTNITMGKRIQIKLEAGDTVGSGIYPVSCFASSGDRKYDVLRAGCGDGVIFPKDVGFDTTGNVSYSPYFKAFGFVEAPSLFAIECVVTECTSNCEGDSCRNSNRRRREAENDDNHQYYVAVTSTKTLIDPTPLYPTDQQPDDTSISVENSQSGNNVEAGLPKIVTSQTSSEQSESSKNGYEFFSNVIYHEAKESPSRVLNPPLQKDENIPVDPITVGKVYEGIIGRADNSVDEDEYGKSSQEDAVPQTSALDAEDAIPAEDVNKPLPVQTENIPVDSQEAPNSVLDAEDDITAVDVNKPLPVQTENIPVDSQEAPNSVLDAEDDITAEDVNKPLPVQTENIPVDSQEAPNSVLDAEDDITAEDVNKPLPVQTENIPVDSQEAPNSVLDAEDDITAEDVNKPLPVQTENIPVDSQEAPNSVLDAEDDITAEDVNKPLPVQTENIPVDSQEAPNSVLDAEDDITAVDMHKPPTVQTDNIPDESDAEGEHRELSQDKTEPLNPVLYGEEDLTAKGEDKPLEQTEIIPDKTDAEGKHRKLSQDKIEAQNPVLDGEEDLTTKGEKTPLQVQDKYDIPVDHVRLNSAKHSLTANPKESDDEDKHGHMSQKDSTESQKSVKDANEGLTAKNEENQLQSEDENIQVDQVRVTAVYHHNTISKHKDSDENVNGKTSQTFKQRIVSKPKDPNTEGEQDKQRKGTTEPQASIITVTTNSTEDVEYRGKTNTMTGAVQNETLRGKLQMQQSDRVSTHGMPKSPRNPEMSSYGVLNGQSRIVGLLHPRKPDDLKQSKPNHTEDSNRNQSHSKTNNSTKSLQKYLVRPDIGRAMTPLMHVIPKGEESTPNATLSDVFIAKDNIPVHKKEESHALSKPIAMYVVGTVIVALFSLANIALAISLCKRQD